jgi:putative ABC transport system permease protein
MNTMVMSVHERTREIGILRAVGWRVRRVIRMVLLEAVFLSLLGAACGTLGAWAILRLLTRVPAVNGVIDGRIEPILIFYGFAIAIGVGLLGGLIPAQRAAKMMPTEALRHE